MTKLTLEKHEFIILKSIIEDRLCKLEDIISKNSDKLDEYENDIKNYTTYDIHRKLMEVKWWKMIISKFNYLKGLI